MRFDGFSDHGGSGPKSLDELVESLRRDPVIGPTVRGAKLLECWEEIVGEKFADKVKPLEVRRGVLTVLVPNSVWTHEFMCCSDQVRSRIAKLVGMRIDRIRCKQSSDVR